MSLRVLSCFMRVLFESWTSKSVVLRLVWVGLRDSGFTVGLGFRVFELIVDLWEIWELGFRSVLIVS